MSYLTNNKSENTDNSKVNDQHKESNPDIIEKKENTKDNETIRSIEGIF